MSAPTLPNTLGIRFLRSVIDHGALSLFRATCDASLFLEEERPAYQKVASHVAAYNQLPSLHAMQVEGVSFPVEAPVEPPAYHADLLRRRAAYNEINARFPSLAQQMKAKDMDGAVATLREMLAGASGKVSASSYSSLDAEAALVLDDYFFAKQHAGLRGVPMRWTTLNDYTGGAQGGDLIVIAGRPGVGKSWTLFELAVAANRHGRSAGIVSMEMGLMQLARRWIGLKTGINPNNIRDGQLPHWAEDRMIGEVEAFSTQAPVHLLRGDMRKSVDGLATLVDEFEPDVLYVDAAYLLSPSGRKQGYISRWETLSEVIRELKQLALHKNKPIIITVQFNRNQKDRPRKAAKDESPFPTPDLGDIAGTDSIPQDASVVLGQTLWPPPFAQSRRVLHGMKNREGEQFAFGINFAFNPINFDEIPLVLDTPGTAVADTSWML